MENTTKTYIEIICENDVSTFVIKNPYGFRNRIREEKRSHLIAQIMFDRCKDLLQKTKQELMDENLLILKKGLEWT